MFLGFSFYKRKGEVLVRMAKEARERCQGKLRQLTRRTRHGHGKVEAIIRAVNEYTMGWVGYFALAARPRRPGRGRRACV